MEIEMERLILNERIREAAVKAAMGDKQAADEWSDLVQRAEDLDTEWMRDVRARHSRGERMSFYELERLGLPTGYIPL